MSDGLREAMARLRCKQDRVDPDAKIYIGMREAKAWEARLPLIDEFFALFRRRRLRLIDKLRKMQEKRCPILGHRHDESFVAERAAYEIERLRDDVKFLADHIELCGGKVEPLKPGARRITGAPCKI